METLSPTQRTVSRLAWVVLAMALVFSMFVRARLAAFPLERDEGEYAYAGQLILQGIPPYILAYNMKLPGTYLAYAGLMAVFGQTTVGIHLGLLAVNLATIGLIFFFARDLFDTLTGAAAAACFAVLSSSPSVMGTAAHATHFVTVFGVAGAWVLWRAIRSQKPWLFAASGLLLGLAFLMKQQGVFLPVFGGLAVLVSCVRPRPVLSRRHLALCLSYAVGAVLPLAATCLWLWLAGTFDKFWFWTVQYARTYVEQIPLKLGFEIFWDSLQGVIGANWPIWALGLAGAIGLVCSGGVPGRRAFVFTFLVFSFLCVCPGFYFRQHYFIVLLPCVAILAGIGFVAIVGLVSRLAMVTFGTSSRASPASAGRRNRGKAKTASPAEPPSAAGRGWLVGLAALIPAAAVVSPVWQQRDYYFSWWPEQACRHVYWPNPFVECPVIADYLRNNSSPEDRIAVFGSEPEIFFDSRRNSATGYIYAYPLMEVHPYARTMQEDMIREIESAQPKFAVVVNVHFSWLGRGNSETLLTNWIPDYLAAHYHAVGLVDIFPDRPSVYKWDAEVAGAQPRSTYNLWVFRRNP